MNKKTNKNNKKWFITHKDNILKGIFNEDNKIYFNITSTKSIKDIVNLIEEFNIKNYEKDECNNQTDIARFKKHMEKYGKKQILKDIQNNNYIIYSEEEIKLEDGKIKKYEPQEIIVETMFEKIFK